MRDACDASYAVNTIGRIEKFITGFRYPNPTSWLQPYKNLRSFLRVASYWWDSRVGFLIIFAPNEGPQATSPASGTLEVAVIPIFRYHSEVDSSFARTIRPGSVAEFHWLVVGMLYRGLECLKRNSRYLRARARMTATGETHLLSSLLAVSFNAPLIWRLSDS